MYTYVHARTHICMHARTHTPLSWQCTNWTVNIYRERKMHFTACSSILTGRYTAAGANMKKHLLHAYIYVCFNTSWTICHMHKWTSLTTFSNDQIAYITSMYISILYLYVLLLCMYVPLFWQ